jgi:inhibitor of KinA
MTPRPAATIVRIAPAGDAALVLEFPPRIDPRINAHAIAIAETLQRRCGTAIRDAVVGFATLTVYFDPLAVDADWMEAEMREAAGQIDDATDAAGATIEVPVCYGDEFGPDLDAVAAFGSCTPEEVVTIHASGTYRVYMVGFVPGFAYLASIDARIAIPRRSTPRTSVSAGSVGIAGAQTGIYPSVTPGGWNIVGRTPLKPYDPGRAKPFLFRAGDTVRFRQISRDEYNGAAAS